MRDYVHLHRKILTSWVFEDARRLQLFIYLLAKADEQGMVRLSVNECARRLGIDRKWIERRLAEMQQRSIIDQQTTNKGTNLTICNYAYYNQVTADVWAKSDQQMTNKPAFQEEKEGERERNVSPTPLSYKEKEKEREENPQKKNTRTRVNKIEEITTDSPFLIPKNTLFSRKVVSLHPKTRNSERTLCQKSANSLELSLASIGVTIIHLTYISLTENMSAASVCSTEWLTARLHRK